MREPVEANVEETEFVTVDVVLPVLDEAAALGRVLDPARWGHGFRPIVVDNGSSDGSAAVAGSFGVEVVTEPERGFGAACWAGLMAATGDVVAFMDADGSLDAADLPLVVAPVLDGRADLALGARVALGGSWPLHARVANRYLARQVRHRTGVVLHDLGPMRAARRLELVSLGVRDRRFGWPLEMVLRAARAGWRIEDVAVPYRPRVGRSKVTGTVSGTLAAVRDMRRLL